MSKSAPTISVLTANRLSDGAVVFLDFDGVWVESLRGAVVARSPDEVRALESRGAFDAARNIVVEPYLVEMHEAADGNLTPVRFRATWRPLPWFDRLTTRAQRAGTKLNHAPSLSKGAC